MALKEQLLWTYKFSNIQLHHINYLLSYPSNSNDILLTFNIFGGIPKIILLFFFCRHFLYKDLLNRKRLHRYHK
jgi:hypothetical protein